MLTVLGWATSILPLLWFFVSKALPKLLPAIMAAAGRGGIIATICSVIVAIYKFIRKIPVFLLAIQMGSGVLGRIFSAIRFILNFGFKFPVIAGFTLVLGQFFPTIYERIFMVVGAVSIKIGLAIFGNMMSLINGSAENNMVVLKEMMGQSASYLPPCMVDVLAYMHIVEDIGMLLSTCMLIMTYNLVRGFAFKFIK